MELFRLHKKREECEKITVAVGATGAATFGDRATIAVDVTCITASGGARLAATPRSGGVDRGRCRGENVPPTRTGEAAWCRNLRTGH